MNASINYKNIKSTLSEIRLSSYDKVVQNEQQALELYWWNVEVSSAFWTLIQVCEVTVRNAVSAAITMRHGNRWAWENSFIWTLTSSSKRYNVRAELEKAKIGANDINNVIPKLNLIFWQKMFISAHDNQIWQPFIKQIFVNATDIEACKLRAEIHDDLEFIRRLRNRVAHHEPIFNQNLEKTYNIIIKIISYRCIDTANWLMENQQVTHLLANRPKV